MGVKFAAIGSRERTVTNFLLTLLVVFSIIAAYCLFVGLYDRQFKSLTKKRDWLVGIVVVSSGIFSAMITSAYYIDGWNMRYLAPILLFAAATAAVVAYICLLKKIYAARKRREAHGEEDVK